MVYPDSRDWVDWDVQGHRLVSTLLDPNFAGAFVMMPLLVQVALISTGEHVARWKPLLLVAALLATASRGSILATIIGLGVIVLVRGRSKKLMSLFGVLAIGLAIALPKLIQYASSFNKLRIDDPSAMARLVSWARALTVFADHPIIGIGFNTWSAVQTQYGWEQVAGSVFGLDGGLLFIAVLTGILGLTLYVAMFIFACRRSYRIWRNAQHSAFERGMAIGIAASTIALVIHSLFVNSLLLPFLMEPLWVLWAIGFAIRTPEIAIAPAAERRKLAA
jgi:O-antigen ligase